jgi:YVTN family beta-propeller protein
MKNSQLLVATFLGLAACNSPPAPRAVTVTPPVSSTIAITADDQTLWVVNPDADSVSAIDVTVDLATHAMKRRLLAEIPLATNPPHQDSATGRYEPSVKPRALCLLPGDQKVYVAGQTANRVFVLDANAHTVLTSIPVAAEPTGVVAAADGSAVYVVSHQGAKVTKIDPATDKIVGTPLDVHEHPWGAALSADGQTLFVTHLLVGSGVTLVDTASLRVQKPIELANQPPDPLGKLIPNGVPRGVYSAAEHPSAHTLWMPHLLLAIDTPQPDLDFQSTVFPTISILPAATWGKDGKVPPDQHAVTRLQFAPLDPPGAQGAFIDVVSGPRAIAFTPDGSLALLVDAQSEDVLVLDGKSGNERGLVRPLPSAFPEGIAISHDGHYAYVEGRNTHDVSVLRINAGDAIAPVVVDGAPIERLVADPMPPTLRLGQRLFYSANSAAFPITRNFWVACSSCHLEGGTDAVTWKFTVGPRDTPSNAGGPINTGFLLRQALRNSIIDYDTTINIEQGGNYHREDQMRLPELEALRDFVNLAIPFPQNPNRSPDATLTGEQAAGQATFEAHCARCHTGPYLTDSGVGNPTLDLAGYIELHDIGTCVHDRDQPAPDEVTGKMHTACDFDTPTLRGIFATAPYFHDGSAPDLSIAVDLLSRRLKVKGVRGKEVPLNLTDGEKANLVSYLLTL